MNKELEEAKQNLIQQLEKIKIANECGLATKGEFNKDINAIETILNYIENSISKEKVEKVIEKINRYEDTAGKQIEKRIIIADSDSLNLGRRQAHGKDIEELKELLEGK